MSFPLEAAAARGGLDQGHPKAMAFLETIHARPAYKRALERAVRIRSGARGGRSSFRHCEERSDDLERNEIKLGP